MLIFPIFYLLQSEFEIHIREIFRGKKKEKKKLKDKRKEMK